VSVADLDSQIVLTVPQVAELAQVSEDTVRRQIAQGHLRARRIASCVRVLRVEADRWLASDGSAP